MRTIKLVIIGDSGVGKTSLRNQYVSGRFSTGYRATIGTDFITKTLPHYQNPEESVTLQIWDTAGQERFSSLSTAFFRGADAALLMFDVNRPETLSALMKWWEVFKMHAPVLDEEAEDFCCVVIGNKIDLVEDGETYREINGHAKVDTDVVPNGNTKTRVSEAEAERFLEELVPRTSSPNDADVCEYDEDDDPFVANGDPNHSRQSTGVFMRRAISGFSLHSVTSSQSKLEGVDLVNGHADHDRNSHPLPRTRSESISIYPNKGSAHPFRRIQKSRSSSLLGGTMTTTHTTQTIFHTPSSSIFDHFESAPSSPFYDERNFPPSRSSGSISSEDDEPATPSNANGMTTRVPRRMTSASPSSTSSSSAPTITPSLFMRTQASGSAAPTSTPPTPLESCSSASCTDFPFRPPSDSAIRKRSRKRGPELPPRPERRPRLFLTSAKTGEGVSPVFEHIARRVCMGWAYAEALEALGLADQPVLNESVAGNGAGAGAGSLRLRGWNESAVRLRERLKSGGNCCGS